MNRNVKTYTSGKDTSRCLVEVERTDTPHSVSYQRQHIAVGIEQWYLLRCCNPQNRDIGKWLQE